MKEKAKAKEIFDKYFLLATELNPMASLKARVSYAKKCALICVDEILQLWNKGEGRMIPFLPEDYKFWLEVKKEIKLL